MTPLYPHAGFGQRARHFIRSFAVLTVLAAAVSPLPAHAGLITSRCTTTINSQIGSCTLPLAGPNLYIEIEVEGSTTSSTAAVVAASISFGNDVASFGLLSCAAQGQVQLTRKLTCFASFGPGEAGMDVAELPAGAPLTCFGFKAGSTKPARLTCSTTTI